MQINVNKAKDFFKGAMFNKNKAKFFVAITIAVYIILSGVLIYQYSLIQRTISVCVTNGPIIKNQMITKSKVKEYKMTLKEFYRYALLNSPSGVTNRLVEWYGINPATGKKEAGYGANKIIGKYSAYSLKSGEFYMPEKITDTYIDNSRLILDSYPGKNIVELDINNSNLETFKNILRVGDKINISCSYNTQYQLNLSLEGVRNKNNDATQEVQTTVVDDLFIGITIADILNTKKESLLDYTAYLNQLPTNQRLAIEKTEDHAKKMKVSNLLLAMTPEEEAMYRLYCVKDNVVFNISLPQVD